MGDDKVQSTDYIEPDFEYAEKLLSDEAQKKIINDLLADFGFGVEIP